MTSKTRKQRTASSFLIRHSGWVALLGLLSGAVGAFYSVQLFKNLRTNLEELLPTTARSVVDLNEVSTRLESIENLVILVFTQNGDAGKKFVDALAARLEKLPKQTVASVEYKIDRELAFFKARQALYLDLPDLTRLREYIKRRIDYETTIRNPLTLLTSFDEDEGEIPEPKLDFEGLRRKYRGQTSTYERFPDGYYATPDRTKWAVLAYMPGKSSSIDQVKALKSAVLNEVAALDPKSFSPDLEVKYTGGVQETLEEHDALVEDLLLSSIIVTLIVTLALWVFFRSWAATLALTLSLFIGTFWTFGVSYFAVGNLNANSAFLGSIVLGNGINFGIIFLARYIEERRRRRGSARAAHIALRATAGATLTASLAAGLAYGSLMLTSFRGFNQFGVIGLIGMVLCWISAFTTLPAFLVLFERVRPLFRASDPAPKAWIAGAVAHFVARFPKLIWTLSAAISFVSFVLLFRFDLSILETNFTNLRNKHSVESGAAYLSRYQDEIFQRYLSPLVLLPRSERDVAELLKRLDAAARAGGENTMIASVSSLESFVPKDQAKKVQILREIRAQLPEKLVVKLDPTDQRRVRELLQTESLKPFTRDELPALVRNKFTERDGTRGKMVLVEPPLDQSTLEGRKVVSFISELRSIADAVEPGMPVAGTLTVSADMISAISSDGPKATLFAFGAVVILVLFLFRSAAASTLALIALGMGILWMAGIMAGFWLKVNFLNFIALPITFGIGVDYGVNMFNRYRSEGGGRILDVIRSTGGAVGLCSLTTIVGYGSLIIASNQGFVSFGRLAVIGELTCLVAAVIALPAYLVLRERRHSP